MQMPSLSLDLEEGLEQYSLIMCSAVVWKRDWRTAVIRELDSITVAILKMLALSVI